MGFNSSSGFTTPQQVVLSGSIAAALPVPSATQTIVQKGGSVVFATGTTNCDVYTVTGGKTFYMTGFGLNIEGTGAMANSVYMRDGAGTQITPKNVTTLTPPWTSATLLSIFSLPTPIKFTTSVNIVWTGALGSNYTNNYFLIGYEI